MSEGASTRIHYVGIPGGAFTVQLQTDDARYELDVGGLWPGIVERRFTLRRFSGVSQRWTEGTLNTADMTFNTTWLWHWRGGSVSLADALALQVMLDYIREKKLTEPP